MKSKTIWIGILLLGLALILAACQSQAPAATGAPVPTAQACPTAAACPAIPTQAPPPEPVVKEVPFEAAWAGSPHNAKDTEPFMHWNEADPKEIPVDCAKCHSTPGYLDFIGADGSAAGAVDKAAPIGTTIQCIACHNDVAASMTSVTFPSGVEITGLGPSARCMQCHQGRASRVQVDAAIEKAGLTADPDKASADLGFVNIHYFAAAATLYGTATKGGYEYDGKPYDFKNDHVAGYDACIGCHNQHTLEIRVDECKVCHTNVASKDDLKNIRMFGSKVDYDGDGDVTEGIAGEIAGLQGMLLTAIQSYAKDVAGSAIAYNAAAYPYFFADANGNGTVDDTEKDKYTAWTPRLLKAAYNYQTSIKDPGTFAHGGKYIIELLYDSIEDVDTKLAAPVDLSKAVRIDAGHFAGSEEAFRHWDEAGEVPANCARCHSGKGLATYLKEGVNISAPVANGFNCANCHDDLTTFTRRAAAKATFPSGASITFGEKEDANLCIQCHQGRESKVSVDRAITASTLKDDDVATADKPLSFRNPHYFAAGATLFGTQAKGAYEYNGQTYNGRNMHTEKFDTCVECHDAHALTVRVDSCANCHEVTTVEDLQNVRMTPQGQTAVDYDGDGNATEGIAGEITTMDETLYAAIQAYAKDKLQAPIVYSGANYPYFFADTNGNGVADPDEIKSDNSYKSWTPRLLRAAYNHQWVAKDPGAFAHNGKYILQILYDSIKNTNGSVTGMTRPPVTAAP